MNVLAFAFVIAFILEDYGTFQTKTIDQCTPEQQVEMFRKYALELVSATIEPFHKNIDIMEGGCECIPILQERGKSHPYDLLLAVMSMVKDHLKALELIRRQNISQLFKNGIDVGLMENIRKILVGMRKSSVNLSMSPIHDALKKHYFKLKRASSNGASGSSEFNKNFEPAMKCYTSMLSLLYGANKKFFVNFDKGCMVATNLMDKDDDEIEDPARWTTLRKIREDISRGKLTTVDDDRVKTYFGHLLESWVDSDSD